jgi:deazaflavin-dependent oxidoreductase (nitroreductase family)
MPLRDRPPRGPVALLVRLPIVLYRAKLGWLLDSRFLLLRHRGRRSGILRSTVLEVVHRDPSIDAYYVAAAWAGRAQWFRNASADPQVSVTVGRRSFEGMANILDAGERRRVLDQYRLKHGAAMRGLQRLFGHATFDELVEATPIVELRRSSTETSTRADT